MAHPGLAVLIQRQIAGTRSPAEIGDLCQDMCRHLAMEDVPAKCLIPPAVRLHPAHPSRIDIIPKAGKDKTLTPPDARQLRRRRLRHGSKTAKHLIEHQPRMWL